MRIVFGGTLLACLVMTAGCGVGKLDQTKNFSFGPGDSSPFWTMEPQKQAQKIKIEVTSDNEVDVLVLSPRNADLYADKPGEAEKSAMAQKKGIKTETFTVDVPASTEYSVLVGNAKKKATGTVRITNR